MFRKSGLSGWMMGPSLRPTPPTLVKLREAVERRVNPHGSGVVAQALADCFAGRPAKAGPW